MNEVNRGQLGKRGEQTIWVMEFRNRVHRATITQSMFGMLAPLVEIAEQFEDIRFAPEMGGK